MVDLGYRRSLSLGIGFWTLDIEDPSFRSRGRQISLWNSVVLEDFDGSCLKILMASLMRLVCHELIGVMSWAACQSIWWSLM